MALNIEPPVVVTDDVMAEEEPALLTEFRSKPPTEVKISFSGCESPYHLSECNCVLSLKKGRYAESKCEAHKLTLRNSRPHPEPLGSPIQNPSNDTTTPTHRFLASPSRTPLTALLTSHLAGSHQDGSTAPLSSPGKTKAMMKESTSTSALPQRIRESIELEKEGCRVPSSPRNVGLLPSLSTSMLLHLSPANSPASLAAGDHWSPSAKLSSSSHIDKTLCVGMVLGVLTEFHYDECGAVEPAAKGSDGDARQVQQDPPPARRVASQPGDFVHAAVNSARGIGEIRGSAPRR